MVSIPYLSPSVATLYAELLQQVASAEADRTIADLRGTFVSKKIKDNNYWYLQFTEAGKQRQIYLGVENHELLKTIRRAEEGKSIKREDKKNRQNLCRMLLEGGAFALDPISSRILDLLAESGVFRLGAVLVGSHVFIAYGNMMGVQWPRAMKTQDIDVAQEKGISVALANNQVQADLPGILERAEMGFHPIPSLNPKNPSTSFKIRGKETHLDILTPLIGPESSHPVFLPALNVAAQPLRYLDYLIDKVEQAVLPYDDGILVNVPKPARFAFHKLIVSQKRPATNQVKSKKDIDQALLLFSVLVRDRPADIDEAWENLITRGKNWVKPVQQALKQAGEKERELTEKVLALIS